MNLNFLIKKNHIFKRRKFFKYKYNLNKSGKTGLYLKYQTLFELINLKIFKKVLRKKYYKKGLNFKIARYWLIIRPNFLHTIKAKNARMGCGTGNYVRVSSLIKSDRPIFFFSHYSDVLLKKLIKYTKKKMNIDLYIQFVYRKLLVLYKLNKFVIFKNICIRSNYLSRKFFKKNCKSTLVYLRSPKHFNIGKFKIFSFNNIQNEKIELNSYLSYKLFIKYPIYFFKVVLNTTAVHTLRRINSLRVRVITKIKW